MEIKKDLKEQKEKIEMVVLLFANVATISSNLIDKGIKILKKNKKFDFSCFNLNL